MSSDESQSKAQFNLQSLREYKSGCRVENRFFSTDENFKKSLHLFILLFIPSDNMLLCKAMLVRYQLGMTFML